MADFEKASQFWLNEKEPVGKKLETLYKYVNQVAESLKNDEDADSYLGKMETPDYFSKRVKLELANKLKRPDAIFSAFKSDNTLLLQRALQFRWFFESSRLITDPDFVIKEFFPNISYSCKRKIADRIGKMGKSPQQITKLYEAVDQTYGIHLAKLLITACDKELLSKIIEERRHPFNSSQLMQIYKKHPDLALRYLELFYSCRQFLIRETYFHIFMKVAKDSPSEFMEFYEKHEKSIPYNIVLGVRLTHNLLKHDKKRIIKNGKRYARILHQHEIMKRLSVPEFSEFLPTIFPENIRNFQLAFELGETGSGPLFTWLEKFPPEVRFEKLNSSFTAVYGKSILEFPEYMTSRMIQLLKAEDRDKWIDLRLSHPDAESQYLYRATGNIPLHREGYWEAFRGVEKSIPTIKGFLAKEGDVLRRADLLASLVLTCAVNNDLKALAEICQFVPARYRNDNLQVRQEFLGALGTLFNLSKLTEEHWTGINELLQICAMNNEFSYRMHNLQTLMEKSMIFRMKNDLPAEIRHYIQLKSRIGFFYSMSKFSTEDPKLEFKCLKLFADQLSQMYPLTTACPVDSHVTTTIISLAELFRDWNRRQARKNQEDKTFLLSPENYPWMMTRLQDVLNSYHEANKYRVILALDNDLLAKVIQPEKLLKYCAVPEILQYFLGRDPELLAKHSTDDIIPFLLRSHNVRQWKPVLRTIASSGYPNLVEGFVNKCLEVAEDDDSTGKERLNAILLLSFLLEDHHYIDWIAQFYPEEPKADSLSEEPSGPYQQRRAIATSLVNLITPPTAIPALLQFCKGDYLKFTVGPLYSICSRSCGPKLTEFLKELATRPVSVKKHAIRLMLNLSSKSENVKFLKHLWDTEKHHSIRSIVFHNIFSFYMENNSDESWDILTSAIKSLTAEDQPLLGDLGSLGRNWGSLPPTKLSEYLELVLEKLDQIGNFGPESKWVRMNILQCISPGNINNISESLLENIFEKHLFILNDEANLQSTTVNIAIGYLLHYSKAKVETVTKYLDRLTGSSWAILSKDSLTMYPAKQSLSYFIEQLSIESFKTASGGIECKDIFASLRKTVQGVKDTSEFYVDDLFLQLAIIFHSTILPKCNGTTATNCSEELMKIGKDVGKLTDEVVANHKPEIISIFSETLKRFISLCYKHRLTENGSVDGARVIFIIEGILSSTGSIDSQIVASHLLFTTNSHWPKGHPYQENYEKMIKKLTESEDKTVLIFANYRLTQCRPTRGFDVLV